MNQVERREERLTGICDRSTFSLSGAEKATIVSDKAINPKKANLDISVLTQDLILQLTIYEEANLI